MCCVEGAEVKLLNRNNPSHQHELFIINCELAISTIKSFSVLCVVLVGTCVGVGQWFRSLLVVNYMSQLRITWGNGRRTRTHLLFTLTCTSFLQPIAHPPSHAQSCLFWSPSWLLDWLTEWKRRSTMIRAWQYGTCSNSIRQTRKSFMKSSSSKRSEWKQTKNCHTYYEFWNLLFVCKWLLFLFLRLEGDPICGTNMQTFVGCIA